ncbi:unnamed protein product [Lathyrus sativus]|nr:unnamed protein product [Lathyrus sativus]
MANSRIARFFMEVAPPQYVSVMRRRTTKMMETITEEDREISLNDSVISASSPSASACASSSTNATVNTRFFLKEVHRKLSSLNH